MFRISEKLKAFEGVEDQFFSEVVEAFSTRAKKLEIDLLRYETSFAIDEIMLSLFLYYYAVTFSTKGIANLHYKDVATSVTSSLLSQLYTPP